VRITHLIRSDGWAGVERHVAALSAEQSRQGHEVHMIGGDPAIAPGWLDQDAVTFSPVRTLPQAVLELHRVRMPDLLHVHMTAAEVAAAMSIRTRRVPVVSTRHFADTHGSRLLSRPAVRLAERRIKVQISVSQYVADHVEGESTVVHSGVEAREPGLPAVLRDPVVLLVQRLQPEKNTHLALEAFAASGLPALGWRMDVAGTGPLRPSLEQLASELGVGGAVHFLGRRSDVPQLMGSAGLLIAPHDREGYGLAVVEAMAAGLPVIAAAGGGHLETVGRVPGAALFPPGDVTGAAALLRRLALEVDRRDAYGRTLQETQQRELTLAAQARATDLVYRSVL
jgi:glycosyltransferase involved in cell wall biosynthesis